MKNLWLILALLFTCISSAQQFKDLSRELPFDESFRIGVLDNGLKYYIRNNQKPEERVSFYIYQNVGALLETDKQNGLAHFLEHMAFNGTTTFPDKNMLNMLERAGVKFGKDVNAYTAYNETVYNISRVPSKDPLLIDSCLMVLRDWSNNLSLTDAEIEAERGVISEEWRTRRTAAFRIRNQLAPALFNNSQYAKRDVIGSLDVIKNFEPQELRAFYHKWYRSDLQAIGIVGDIDVDMIEEKVKALFSSIPPVDNPEERVFFEIADNNEPIFKIASDKEQKDVNISMAIRHRHQVDNTFRGMRNMYLSTIFNVLISNRIQELAQDPERPFTQGGMMLSSFVRGYKSFNITATSVPEKESEAFRAIYTELQRVLDHGFTQAELERVKTNLLASSKNSYDNRDQITNDGYCEAIKRSFIGGGSIATARLSYDFAQEIIPEITLEDISTFLSQWVSEKNVVYTVIVPENHIPQLSSSDEIENLIQEIRTQGTSPYIDEAPINMDLLDEIPAGGKIVKETTLPAFRAKEWILSNGATVVYRQAAYQKNTIALEAHSFGGMSLYEKEDIPSIKAVQGIAPSLGIGNYNPSMYKKVMTGKTASSAFFVNDLSEKVIAKSNSEDVETMLQLVYMRFNQPRFDEELFKIIIDRNSESLANQVETAQSLMSDTLNEIIYGTNPRYRKYDQSFLDEMDLERMEYIYRDRFNDASDFTFFIVGDIDEEELKPLVERYIGALKDIDRQETWKNNGVYFPKGHTQQVIQIPMEEPKAKVVIKMQSELPWSRKQAIYHSILGTILELRYTETIREKEGGTYNVGVSATSSQLPQSQLFLDISFDCDPARAQHLKSLIFEELKLVTKEIRQEELDKVVLNMRKNYEQSKLNNSYWMRVLKSYYIANEDMLNPGYFDEIVQEVSTRDIAKFAKQFIKQADIVDIIFEPQD